MVLCSGCDSLAQKKGYMMTTAHVSNGIRFTDEDVVNIDDLELLQSPRVFLLHDHGFTLAVVVADNLQDAMDEAVDDGRLYRFQVSDAEIADYPEDEHGDRPGITYLGNASEPFDIEGVSVIELPTVKVSFAASYAAQYPQGDGTVGAKYLGSF